MANKGGGFKKSSGSDQNCFSSQNQTVVPYCTGAESDTASDTDTVVLAAVREGSDVTERSYLPGHGGKWELWSWLSMYGSVSVQKQPRPM